MTHALFQVGLWVLEGLLALLAVILMVQGIRRLTAGTPDWRGAAPALFALLICLGALGLHHLAIHHVGSPARNADQSPPDSWCSPVQAGQPGCAESDVRLMFRLWGAIVGHAGEDGARRPVQPRAGDRRADATGLLEIRSTERALASHVWRTLAWLLIPWLGLFVACAPDARRALVRFPPSSNAHPGLKARRAGAA